MSDQRHPLRGSPGRPGDPAGRWRRFRGSPFFPATVLALIIATAAGLFAGSYTYALATPAPHRIPVAVVGDVAEEGAGRAFFAGMERALDSSLAAHGRPTRAAALRDVETQRVFAVLYARADGSLGLDVSGASGSSVAELLSDTARKVGGETGARVRVRDVKPLASSDPRGLALFYISLAAVITGFVGAIQMGLHARSLTPLERMAFTAAYALLGGLAIVAAVDWFLDAIDFPFPRFWVIVALTMFASGMVFTMFSTLVGRWAVLPTWGLMVIVGNPSSGGAVSWPLLPSFFAALGRWLPPGASVNALHTAVYFRGHQHLQPYVALTAWAAVSCAVFWTWRHRHPGGRDTAR